MQEQEIEYRACRAIEKAVEQIGQRAARMRPKPAAASTVDARQAKIATARVIATRSAISI